MKRIIALLLLLLVPAPAFAVASLTYIGTAVDTTNSTTYSFVAQAIGSAAADRCVEVVAHSGISAQAAFTVTGITIAGNAATIVYQQDADVAGITRLAAVGSLLVAAGTTATIGVVTNTAANRMRIDVLTLTGTSDCTSLADSDFSEATDPSVALDVPANGTALGACTDTGTGAYTWTGLTERNDNSDEGATMQSTVASLDFVAAQTGLTITCDSATAADSAEIGIFMSWGPAAAGAAKPARMLGGGVF